MTLREEFETYTNAELVDHALELASQIDQLEVCIRELMAMIRRNCPQTVQNVAENILQSNGVDHE